MATRCHGANTSASNDITTSASVKPPKLSRAQRTMLHNAVHGRALGAGLTRNSTTHKISSTLQALHRLGMLAGIEHQPTEAGRTDFSPPERQKAPQGA